MSRKIVEDRSLAVQFALAHPCCIRVIPYQNGTLILYVHTDDKGILKDVKDAAEELFADYEIECVDLQCRPLTKIIARLSSSQRQKSKELSQLSRKIEENLDIFKNRLSVTAVCASYKVTDAVEKDTPCVTVFVLGKGKVPAGETEFQKIKEDNGNLFGDHAELDVVEGYYQPAYGPFSPSEMASYTLPLCGGVGIGVQGDNGVGTLGGFLEDEEGECYILSNEHVLHNPELENNKIIEHPALRDYVKELETAKRNYEDLKKNESYTCLVELTQEEKDKLLESNDRYLKRKLGEIEKKKQELTDIRGNLPRKIGVYVDGLKDNFQTSLGGNPCKVFVDVAIAKLDKEELNYVMRDQKEKLTNGCAELNKEESKDGDNYGNNGHVNKDRHKTKSCPLYGFENIENIIPNGETVALETLVDEIRAQDPEKPETKLTFTKIGRTTGLTKNGLIYQWAESLFVKCVSAPKEKPCACTFSHIRFPYHTHCKPSDINEGKLIRQEREPDGVQVCVNCNGKLNICEVLTLWKHNCFVIHMKKNPFCDEGDSGSLIFDNHGRAWGLVHGVFHYNNQTLCLASPLSVALDALQRKCGKKLKLYEVLH